MRRKRVLQFVANEAFLYSSGFAVIAVFSETHFIRLLAVAFQFTIVGIMAGVLMQIWDDRD